ncbi:MAG: sensor histidine kinase [Candidatus Sumerlaeota bacterium]
MKITLKFILAIITILITLRSFEGVMTIQRETNRLNANIRRDAELVGRILKTSLSSVWQESGSEQALNMIDAFNLAGHPIRISWVPNEGENGLRKRLDAESWSELQSGRMASLRLQRQRRGEVQYFYVPLDVPGADGAIQLAETLEERSRYVRNALFREIVVGSIIVVVGGGTMLFLGLVLIGRPLSRLRKHINRIGDGEFSTRIHLRGHDEFSSLANGLNAMCDKLSASRQREIAETEKRVEALEQMRHMDRLTTIGRFAAGVAHELGTPLNVIAGRAGMIAEGALRADAERVRDMADTIKLQVERMTGIIQRLLDFARQSPPSRVIANGLDVTRQAVDLVDCLGYSAEIHVEPHGETASLDAEMDPIQMQQVLTNIIENALQAMPEGGNAIISVRSLSARPPSGVDAMAGRFLQFAVRDEGDGIAEETLPHIFDPFFTTKDVGQGTGLGLSITHGIVREHGGWIEVTSEKGKGSCFAIYIPQERA